MIAKTKSKKAKRAKKKSTAIPLPSTGDWR